jgi:acetylornithine deacetylase/succinyl-diaminopimelate desuccinylase-like protein
MSSWKQYLDREQPRFVAEFLDFCRIPSISSLPEHAHDVRGAARWVADRVAAAGMEGVEILETGGHPMVVAEHLHAPGRPTVLIYGHFDTQPVDPLALWDADPFDPQLRDGRVYARGASDDKGGMLAPILAVEALLESEGTLPVNVKFFFEGQEEIGSPTMAAFVAANRERFACDMVISADGAQWAEDQPSLTLAFKGLCALQIDVKGAYRDLHSGMYGGAVANPIHALAHILASMRGADGKILVDGFFDDVRDLTDDDRERIAAVGFDETKYQRDLQVDALVGDPGYTTLERAWARPTLEVNGFWGGFQGEGVKTVLPNEAHAKVTCRLVANQTPAKVADAIEAHVQRVAPPGVRVAVRKLPQGAMPYEMPFDHPGNVAAAAVLRRLYGKEPYFVRAGGSIPVVGMFLESLGVDTVGLAFGLDDENVHAPNEFYRLSSLRRAQEAYAMLLHELADQVG